MDDQDGEQLVDELLADPRKFDDEGKAYALLQLYFKGFPVETLRPLLRSDNVFVQRSAAFVASELGGDSRNLVDDLIPLLSSVDRHVSWYAMEALTVCCKGEHIEKFAHVARMLESDDNALRGLAMRLVSNADVSQLEAAWRFFGAPDSYHRTHADALHALVAAHKVDPTFVVAMMHDPDPLIRRYGAIAAKRVLKKFPHLIMEAGSSVDSDLRRFHDDVVDVKGS